CGRHRWSFVNRRLRGLLLRWGSPHKYAGTDNPNRNAADHSPQQDLLRTALSYHRKRVGRWSTEYRYFAAQGICWRWKLRCYRREFLGARRQKLVDRPRQWIALKAIRAARRC